MPADLIFIYIFCTTAESMYFVLELEVIMNVIPGNIFLYNTLDNDQQYR